MRFSIYLLLSIFWGCSQKEPEYSYIKIFKTSTTDSVNSYNKGFGLSSFVYYSPSKDSLVYCRLADEHQIKFNTFIAQLNSRKFKKSFDSIINIFSNKKNGIVSDSIPKYSVYCGPEYYLEFSDKKGIHFFLFQLEGDSAFNQVDKFFHQIPELPINKKATASTLISSDDEIVTAMKKLELYDKKEVPYIPLKCYKEIDFSKLAGNWRMVNNFSREKENYHKLTITNKGDYISETVRKNYSESKNLSKYIIDKQDSTLIVYHKKTKGNYKIEIASDSCLQLYLLKYNTTIRFNRL